MIYGKDFDFEGSMSDAVEGGAVLAWRLLATLEGGSLILLASALLAYTARNKIFKQGRSPRSIHNVLVTNTTNSLGIELKERLERRGCIVRALTSEATSGAINTASGELECFDALVIIGAHPKTAGLDGIADLVSNDVYSNLKHLELLSPLIKTGGCIVWACAGADRINGSFSDASSAFETVLQSGLQHVAKMNHCESVWIGRRNGIQPSADDVVDAILNSTDPNNAARFSVRYAAHKAGEYVCRWLKIVT